jgi:hypothetical protein
MAVLCLHTLEDFRARFPRKDSQKPQHRRNLSDQTHSCDLEVCLPRRPVLEVELCGWTRVQSKQPKLAWWLQR